MKKKIDVNDLTLGMYVSELDRPWRDTPFLFQGFEITMHEDLKQLRRYCKYVYIDANPKDTAARRSLEPRAWPVGANVPEDKETDKRDSFTLAEEPSEADCRQIYEDQTTLQEEIEVIRETHTHASTLIHEILEDVHLGQNMNTAAAKKAVAEMAQSVFRNPDALVCFTVLKNKDDYTALHCLRVCILGLAFGRHLGFDEEGLNLLGIGCLLHDIGKMKVPLEILNKPARLTQREFKVMKSHVPRGVEILENTKGIPDAATQVARLHHERYSGSGYINHLQGDQISQFGLIGAIVDTYDAITSDRVYHHGISTLDALGKMYEWRDRDFHPLLVEEFIQCIGVFPIGSVVLLNTGEVGVVITVNRARQLKPKVVLVLRADHTPYSALKTIDLAHDKTPEGRPYEIKTVVAPGEYGIKPTEYLPVIEPK